MPTSILHTLGAAAVAVSAVFLVQPALAQGAAAAAGGPFNGLSGSWSGSGAITLGSGERERIRCRINYDVNSGGNGVQQELRCASDSYKFELNADIRVANGYLSGNWVERTRNLGGNVSGRATSGLVEALAETSGFSAFLTLITRGDRQTVTIKSKSTEIAEVSIALRRASR